MSTALTALALTGFNAATAEAHILKPRTPAAVLDAVAYGYRVEMHRAFRAALDKQLLKGGTFDFKPDLRRIL